MKTSRSPVFGIMPGDARVIVTVEKPVDIEREIPFLLTSSRATTRIAEVAPTSITLENSGRMPVFYSLYIVPRFVAEAARTPWRKLWAEFRSRLEEMKTGRTEGDPK